jgi:hypothetical protein
MQPPKKDPYPLPFIEEVLDMVARHEEYSFFDRFFGYHKIMIALKNQYKIAFITKWGAFMWLFMPFRLTNTPKPTNDLSIWLSKNILVCS